MFRPPVPAGPYLVAGLGRAGRAAAAALASISPAGEIWVNDDQIDPLREAEALAAIEPLGVRRLLNEDGPLPEDLDPFPATLIKSPGIRADAPLIASARAANLTVIDEAELGWRLDPRAQIAVTGTNGKSTTVMLVAELLRAAGFEPVVAGNTTFGPPLSTAPEVPGDTVVAEISSFQLEGCRELMPDAAVLTNLTEDHHYRHGDAQSYGACKRSLFVRGDRAVGFAAIGVDQPFGRELADELESLGSTVVRFGAHPTAARRVLAAEWSIDGGVVKLSEGLGTRTLRTNLAGGHNALNTAGALALSDALGLDADVTAAAIEQAAPLPGRFEPIMSADGLEVIVDYAHNPDGVARSLDAGRAILDRRGGGSLIVVASSLSAVGEHQGSALGRAAAERADRLVLTSHRWSADEDFEQIAPGMLDGARAVAESQVSVEYDRCAAIAAAISDAAPGDLVMVLERGAVAGRLYDRDGVAHVFDDREVVRELLAERPGVR